jgi:hypothetical protein
VLENSSAIGMELAALLVTNQRAAVLRAEHEVNHDAGKEL